MEEFIEFQQYISSFDNINTAYQVCETELLRKPGIYKVIRMGNRLNIGFNIYEISSEEITSIMEDLGLKLYRPNASKGVISNWLDKLVKTNKASFNGKRLDCCDLNN